MAVSRLHGWATCWRRATGGRRAKMRLRPVWCSGTLNTPKTCSLFAVNCATRESTIFPDAHCAFGWLRFRSLAWRFRVAISSCARELCLLCEQRLKHWHISFQNAAQKRWFCGALCRLREKPDSWRVFPKADLEYRLKSFGPMRRHALGSNSFR